MLSTFRRRVGAGAVLWLAALGSAGLLVQRAGAQWTQWGGPSRDFNCHSPPLAERWPEGGPPVVWSRDFEAGHSAICVVDGLLYTMVRRGDQEIVVAMRADDGAPVWEHAYDAPPKPEMLVDFPIGPHGTPLIVGDRVFTVGGTVIANCLDRKTGKQLWTRDLLAEYGASHIQRGYGPSPIAVGDLVVFATGGRNCGVLALKQSDGTLAWKTDPTRPTQSSPILVEFNGVQHLIAPMGPQRMGLDPATGKIRWKVEHEPEKSLNMSTPVWIAPDKLFFSAAYGGGSQLYQLVVSGDGYECRPLWDSSRLKCHHGTVIRVGEMLVASSGDFGPAFLMALRLDTGEMLWRERSFAKANLLLADGKLIILDERGELALARATPEKLEILCRASVLTEKSWTVPTLVGTRLYLRDHDHIKCLELGRGAAEERKG